MDNQPPRPTFPGTPGQQGFAFPTPTNEQYQQYLQWQMFMNFQRMGPPQFPGPPPGFIGVGPALSPPGSVTPQTPSTPATPATPVTPVTPLSATQATPTNSVVSGVSPLDTSDTKKGKKKLAVDES